MKLRFKVVFSAGALLLILMSLIAGWSLVRLKSEIDLRRTYSALQTKLDDLLYSLQEADNSLLAYKLTENDDEFTSFLLNLSEAQKEISELQALAEKSPEVQAGVMRLKDMMEEKIKITQSIEFQKNLGQSLRNRAFKAIRNDLLLTDAIRDRTSDIYDIFANKLKEHQGFVDRYFDFNLVTYVVLMLVTFAFFVVFALQVSNEIDRREKLEVELRQAQHSAVNASQLKSHFLATVSHEIRTPLNGIIGMSELLKDRIFNSELKKFAEVIHSSGQTLLRIVNDILDFSKIEANKLVFELQEVEISKILESATELFARTTQEKNLELFVNYQPVLQNVFLTDGERLSQVLHNLLGNAIKYTASGFVSVVAKVLDQQDEVVTLAIEVVDSGPGISVKEKENIFQPFHRTEEGSHFEGAGLGLSISKRIIEGLNGKIGFDSTEGKGSRFWIQVPVRKISPSEVPLTQIGDMGSPLKFQCIRPSPDAQKFFESLQFSDDLAYLGETARGRFSSNALVLISESELQHETKVKPLTGHEWNLIRVFKYPLSPGRILELLRAPSGLVSQRVEHSENEFDKSASGQVNRDDLAGNLGSDKILLVEDNPTNQLLTKTQLESLGYSVTVVESGSTCLELINRQSFDLIFMDCRMPGMDGFDTARAIRKIENALAVHGSSAGTVDRMPIIALTANAIAGEREKCLAAGMDDYLTKPVDTYRILAMLNRWLSKDQKVFDQIVLDQLTEKTNSVVVGKMLRSFSQSLSQSLDQVAALLREKKFAEIEGLAHQLKPSAIALGAIQFGNLCIEMEKEFQSTSLLNELSVNNWMQSGLRVRDKINSDFVA